MLLLDEINRCVRYDTDDNVFDLLKIADCLANSTRGQLHVKYAQRSWETFRKRIKENYSRRNFSNTPIETDAVPQEPDFVNCLRN